MARQFTLTMNKPIQNASDTGALYNELSARFPDLNAGTDDGVTNIISNLFPSPATTKEISFDRGFARESSERNLIQKFGDGYEQRMKDGINTKTETYSVTFSNKIWYEAELLSAFFDITSPKSFPIVLQRQTISVVCESYTMNQVQPEFTTVQAQFRRVYET